MEYFKAGIYKANRPDLALEETASGLRQFKESPAYSNQGYRGGVLGGLLPTVLSFFLSAAAEVASKGPSACLFQSIPFTASANSSEGAGEQPAAGSGLQVAAHSSKKVASICFNIFL